jgi:hypothetical protein
MIETNSCPPCPNDTEMLTILEKMLQENIDITARGVIRQHSELKAASSITRSKERSELLEYYQKKKNELRNWHKRLGKTSKNNIANELAEKDLRIVELENQVEILTPSHIAMINAVGELGGFTKWAKFFENYHDFVEQLNKMNALPNQSNPIIKTGY